ncbi:hypothetical protein AB0G15_05930 [Streptosporangium sp. NPDC023825]|uniref:hypothetical protein n=1 Tax=Streptosporangium sp. NPDC023825 TaxID=3154909 RepID=UPI00341467D1
MDLDQYARLCAWATRFGLCDDHVAEFSWQVYEAGCLDKPDSWVELLTNFLVDEYARTGKAVQLNRENAEIQQRMERSTNNLIAKYGKSGRVKVTEIKGGTS